MTIRDLLRDLLGRGRQPVPQEEPAAQAGTERMSPRVTVTPSRKQQSWEAFEDRLRALTEQQGRDQPVVAGRLQMIGLSQMKAQLGERWPRVADVAHARAQRVLERRLTDADVSMQLGDDGYLVLFAGLSAEEATFKAQAIAREITTQLVGHVPDGFNVPVRVVVHEIGAIVPGGTTDLAAVIAAFHEREHEVGRRPEEPDDRAAELVAGEGEEAVGALRFMYRPVWSRRGDAIVLYSCVPVWREPDDGPGDRECDPVERGVPPHRLDRSALRSVLSALEEMQRDGRSALVVTPVHWGTLVQLRTRRAYLDLCRQAPPALRRQLGFSVVDIPPGAWRAPLAEHLAPLQSLGRFVGARVAPHPSQVWKFVGTGIQAFTFDADGLDLADAVRYRLVEGFIRRAHARQLAAGALSVDDRASVKALLAAGADFLAGDAIAPPVPEPGVAYKLALAV